MINLSDGYEDFPIIFKTILDKGYQIWIDELGSFWAEKMGGILSQIIQQVY